MLAISITQKTAGPIEPRTRGMTANLDYAKKVIQSKGGRDTASDVGERFFDYSSRRGYCRDEASS
jgi:hypothetical protein